MKQPERIQGQDQGQEDRQNGELILQALSIFTPLTTGLLDLEHNLYANADQLPRPIFKLYRKLRDDFESLFSLISAYSSSDPAFNEQKDFYLQEQISLMQAEVTRKPSSRDRAIESRSRGGPVEVRRGGESEQWQLRAQVLEKEVESLKNELRRNDAEYEIEIKKYNYKYQEMQDEIQYYRTESLRAEEYLQAIEGLETQLRVMQEARQRDERLIQNMAWKLRNQQRERFGRTAFLSPKASQPTLNATYSRIHTQYSPKMHRDD